MRLLVVGASGLLGGNVVRAGLQRDSAVCGTYHSTRPAFDIPLTQFDLREYVAFDDVLTEFDPDVVINCAAMTDVDDCETNPELARAINSDAPSGLAAHCEANDIKFVHVSTDYVFNGREREPYAESASPDPAQVYGETKWLGEQEVTRVATDGLVARLSFLWGIHRGHGRLTGFPEWVRNRLQSDEHVQLFTDQRVTPTRAGQAAETLLRLIDRDTVGLFHIACTSCVTPYEFGEALVDFIGENEDRLLETSNDAITREARRPTHSCLDVEKVASTLGISQPTLRDDIGAVSHAFR